MFAPKPGCLLEHQASFMSAFYSNTESHPTPGKDFDYFTLPGPALSVSADLAGMFHDTPQARGLIKFLVSDEAQKHWPSVQAFSANKDVLQDQYLDPVSKKIAVQLTGPTPLCFDASDLMPAIVRGAFYRAVLSYLSDPGSLDAVLAELDQVSAHAPWNDRTVACGG
jgi:alpha-glucoside transport system substrate-binding protein